MRGPQATITREELRALNSQLDGATPQRIIAWASATYGQAVCFATVLDGEGCALVALLAEVAPHVPVLMPDTGYLAPQVQSLRTLLQQRYGLPIRLVRPSLLSATFESDYGLLPDDALLPGCRINRWQPMRGVLSRYAARITARRRALCPAMETVAPLTWDERLGLVEVNPLAEWSGEQLQSFLREHGVPHGNEPETACAGCAGCPQRREKAGAETAAQSRGTGAGRWPLRFFRQQPRPRPSPTP